jgi:hypothetical protein
VDGRAEAVAQLSQGGVGLLGDEGGETVTALGGHLGRGAAGVGLGGERAGLPAALQEAANPGGADAEQVGDLLAGAAALVAGADHPLTQVLGIRFHATLYAARYTRPRSALTDH